MNVIEVYHKGTTVRDQEKLANIIADFVLAKKVRELDLKKTGGVY